MSVRYRIGRQTNATTITFAGKRTTREAWRRLSPMSSRALRPARPLPPGVFLLTYPKLQSAITGVMMSMTVPKIVVPETEP